ncbi:hypothetical protein IEO21_03105 [Rhodonia placenta]|uniref:Rhodanese domain-containing protein n=2 Tax=Rhodonia placenta TaxID=104341 RepID=A0A1X6N2R1_9APHY|nr:hypothetical protein POSPLADRAFT_1142020 [Postia placenta MAD-698-R-SB12]KAF9817911.1 hypothetical protein IEO21_03105 [Postia placenta]OSX62756.1 hypothetical protein POSPLADRAFT_1142020 [Postia placenta MAD-698-R-SB12]
MPAPLQVIEDASAEEPASQPTSPSRSTHASINQSPTRTLDDVRLQVAESLAFRAFRKAETVDGTKVGVVTTLSHHSDERFLKLVASAVKRTVLTSSHLFAVAAPSTVPEEVRPLLFCGSDDVAVQRAGLLIASKFLGRVTTTHSVESGIWIGTARGLGVTSFDDAALWDVVRKASRALMDPLTPPPGSRSISQLLSDARARLERITPRQAYDEAHDSTNPWPVVLVDIRPDAQRRASGSIAGSLFIERNVLEWRFDPRCAHRLAVANRYDLRIIVFCQEGYTSSLAAASLHDLGMLNATDIIGGFSAWKEAGLPADVVPVPPSRSSVSPSDEY